MYNIYIIHMYLDYGTCHVLGLPKYMARALAPSLEYISFSYVTLVLQLHYIIQIEKKIHSFSFRFSQCVLYSVTVKGVLHN